MVIFLWFVFMLKQNKKKEWLGLYTWLSWKVVITPLVKPSANSSVERSSPHFSYPLRLVFTSDGVVVGVVIGSVERCDLVKIIPTESDAEHCIRLWLRCLRSSENCIVGVASSSRRVNQSQCSFRDLTIGWVFRFCFRLRQCSFH